MEQQAPLSLEEAALLLKVGVPTVQSLIEQGQIQAYTEGEQTLIAYPDIVAFLREDQRALSEDGQQPSDLGLISGDSA